MRCCLPRLPHGRYLGGKGVLEREEGSEQSPQWTSAHLPLEDRHVAYVALFSVTGKE